MVCRALILRLQLRVVNLVCIEWKKEFDAFPNLSNVHRRSGHWNGLGRRSRHRMKIKIRSFASKMKFSALAALALFVGPAAAEVYFKEDFNDSVRLVS